MKWLNLVKRILCDPCEELVFELDKKDSRIEELEDNLEEQHTVVENLTKSIQRRQSALDACRTDLENMDRELTLDDSAVDRWAEDNDVLRVDNKAYKQKRKSRLGNDYSIFLNEIPQPRAFEVLNFYRDVNLSGNIKSVADRVGDKVGREILWTDDENLSDSGDYYLLPSETIVDGKGDCEDHAFLVMSAHEDLAGAWGFYDDGSNRYGHAFNAFIHEGELYVLDTVGNRAHIEKYSENSDYVIHYLITRRHTYVLKGGVEFGKLAGWY